MKLCKILALSRRAKEHTTEIRRREKPTTLSVTIGKLRKIESSNTITSTTNNNNTTTTLTSNQMKSRKKNEGKNEINRIASTTLSCSMCVCVCIDFVKQQSRKRIINNRAFAMNVSAKTYYHDIKSDALLLYWYTIPINGFRVYDFDLVVSWVVCFFLSRRTLNTIYIVVARFSKLVCGACACEICVRCFFFISQCIIIMCGKCIYVYGLNPSNAHTNTHTQSLYFNLSPCSIIDEHNIIQCAIPFACVRACECADAYGYVKKCTWV